MKAMILNHEGYSDAGYIAHALDAQDIPFELRFRETYSYDADDLHAFDLIMPLGSLWSPLDYRQNSAIAAEIGFLSAGQAAGRYVLGVCFGAQLLAIAAGARVFRLGQPLIGYSQVVFHNGHPSTPHFFWNHFGFEAPDQSEVLSTGSESCWAYTHDRTASVQFHIDATPSLLARWTAEGEAELNELGISRDAIIDDAKYHERAVVQSVALLLDALLDR